MKLHSLLACDSAYFCKTNFGGFLTIRSVYELTNIQVLLFSFAIVGVAQSMFALYSGLALYAFSTAFVVPCLTTLVSQVGKLKTIVADPDLNPDTDPPDPHSFWAYRIRIH
jgi:hypothetical protein